VSADLEVPYPGPEAPFRAEVERRMNVTIVRLHGELDMAGVEDLKRALDVAQRDPAGKAIVDLRGLTFLDASGLGALLAADFAGRDGQAGVKFITGKHNVQRVFRITGVDRRLEWLPDVTGE
jgi:anti-sigma B factor antagonist